MQTNGFIEPDLLELKVLFSDKYLWRYQFWVIHNRHVTALIEEDYELRLNFLSLQTLHTCIQVILIGPEYQYLALYAISVFGLFYTSAGITGVFSSRLTAPS